MEEVGGEAEIGQRLQDERKVGHVVGFGCNTEESRFGDRAASGHVRSCYVIAPTDLVASLSESGPQHNSGSRANNPSHNGLENPFIPSTHRFDCPKSSKLCTI